MPRYQQQVSVLQGGSHVVVGGHELLHLGALQPHDPHAQRRHVVHHLLQDQPRQNRSETVPEHSAQLDSNNTVERMPGQKPMLRTQHCDGHTAARPHVVKVL